jgi:hypothetical protein
MINWFTRMGNSLTSDVETSTLLVVRVLEFCAVLAVLNA